MSLAQKTTALLRAIPRLTLTDLKPTPNAERVKPRPRGRADGKYCGYGCNGQNTRGQTSRPYLGFEGGQNPFYLRVPRRGAKNQKSYLQTHTVSIEKIMLWIDQGRIDPKKRITMKVLRDTGCIGKSIKRDGVILTGNGKSKLSIPLDIEVARATGPVIEAIEEAGGKLICTYYSPLLYNYHLRTDQWNAKSKDEPKRPLPLKGRMVSYYSDAKHNGYLSEKGDAHLIHTPEQFQRWRPRHVVRSKIWQQNPEWAEKRQEWFEKGMIPWVEENYEYEEPTHWSNYKGPISRYFGPNPEVIPGHDELLPGQKHVAVRSGGTKTPRTAPDGWVPRLNPNNPYAMIEKQPKK